MSDTYANMSNEPFAHEAMPWAWIESTSTGLLVIRRRGAGNPVIMRGDGLDGDVLIKSLRLLLRAHLAGGEDKALLALPACQHWLEEHQRGRWHWDECARTIRALGVSC